MYIYVYIDRSRPPRACCCTWRTRRRTRTPGRTRRAPRVAVLMLNGR